MIESVHAKELQIYDLIRSYNPKTKELTWEPVWIKVRHDLKKHSRLASSVRITHVDDSSTRTSLTITSNHYLRIYNPDTEKFSRVLASKVSQGDYMMIVDKNLIKKIIRIEKAEVLKIPENEFVEIFTRDTNAIANGFFTSCETWKSVKTFKIFYPWLEKTMKSGVGQWWNQIF